MVKLGKTLKEIEKIMEELLNDPEFREEMEEYQKKYGTLTQEDLSKEFTI